MGGDDWGGKCWAACEMMALVGNGRWERRFGELPGAEASPGRSLSHRADDDALLGLYAETRRATTLRRGRADSPGQDLLALCANCRARAGCLGAAPAFDARRTSPPALHAHGGSVLKAELFTQRWTAMSV
ncbi:unnamed protein product [Lampetra planeri]